jgi:hypothetical protein
MKALQIATIFALLVLGAISNNVQPTEMLAQRIPSHGLKMLSVMCCKKKPTVRNDKSEEHNSKQKVHIDDRFKDYPSARDWSPPKIARMKEDTRTLMKGRPAREQIQNTGG